MQKDKNIVWLLTRFRVQTVHTGWKLFQDSMTKCVSREGAAMRTRGYVRGLKKKKSRFKREIHSETLLLC